METWKVTPKVLTSKLLEIAVCGCYTFKGYYGNDDIIAIITTVQERTH